MPAAAILVAAGSGTRLGAGLPKALVTLGGVALVRRAAEALAPVVEHLVVVVPPEAAAGRQVAEAAAGAHPSLSIAAGGARRRDSVLNGLLAADGCDHVLVHDAARALATTDLAARVLAAARHVGAAVPALAIPDTLVRDDAGYVGAPVDRAGVRAVQTPQGFARDLLLEAHRTADPAWDASDDGTMVRALGHAVALVDGEPDNVKVTWPEDVARAEARLRSGGAAVRETRTGIGWDVHPFVDGRPTVLAGVVLDPDRGPAGHSDGDPLAHAVCDALLGAAALGDVGTLFPDTDPRWKGAPGLDLLARTAAALRAAGFEPRQVDAVLVTDAPKIGPRRDEIRARLAGALGIPEDRVFLKGKRTEGLGGLAGGRGIACHAVAVVAGP